MSEATNGLPAPPPEPPPVAHKQLDAYYDCMRKCYWVKDKQQTWIPNELSSLKMRLARLGYPTTKGDKLLSMADEYVLAIQDQRAVQYVGPLAGFKAGLHQMGGYRILVTHSYETPKLAKGDWSMLRGVIERMLDNGDEFKQVQSVYFYGWLKLAMEALLSGNHTLGQALVLCGPKCSGKSLLQFIITQALGGRSSKPFRYMMGGTTFNRELFGAEHLMIEDEVVSLDMRGRRAFGAQIKQITATTNHSCHGKQMEAVTLAPFRRLSISLNEEPENVAILPPLDDSIEDKMQLFRVSLHPMPMPTDTPEGVAAFKEAIQAQIPHMLEWLKNEFEIPKELKMSRYGIQNYAHPMLRAIIDGLAPHTRILYLIDRTIFGDDQSLLEWVGTADDLHHMMVTGEYRYQAKQMLCYPSAMGTLLGQLAKSRHDRVKKSSRSDHQLWTILRDPKSTPSAPVVNRLMDFVAKVDKLKLTPDPEEEETEEARP